MDLQSFKTHVRLSEIIGQDVRLKKSGRKHVGLCPFHMEKTPSFWVDNEKGLYHCFGCAASGDVFTYLVDKKGMHFKDAILYLSKKTGIQLPDSFFTQKETKIADEPLLVIFEKATIFFETALKENEWAQAYLKRRYVTDAMVKSFRLGLCPDDTKLWQYLKPHASEALLGQTGLFTQNNMPRFRGRLIFPIRDKKGLVIAFGGRTLDSDEHPKYLNSPENPYFKKKEILYGFYEGHTLEKKQQYIFVEGYLDVIKLHQHGFTGAVASMGTALTAEHVAQVWRYNTQPVIALDGDQAGKRATFRSVEKLMPFLTPYKTVTIAELPDDTDPDQLMDQDPTAFKRIIEAPQSVLDFLWTHFETQLKTTKTPEEIAAIQETIKQLCNSIQHKDLSRIYFATLNKFLWRYIYKKPAHTQTAHKLTPIKNNRLLAEILLATILNHPIILDEVHDNLGRAEFSEPDLEKMRCQILDGYYNNYEALVQPEFDEERLLVFAPFVRKTADLEDVRMGWWEVWSQLFGAVQSTNDDWTMTCKLKQVYVEDQ
ncbi:MAG: DNA primase [Pseudomonadota bacterium]